jgi:Protein of unknown function (DUF2490)
VSQRLLFFILLSVILSAALSRPALAAETTGNTWVILNLDHALNDSLDLHFDGTARQTADVTEHRQHVLRFAPVFSIAENLKASLGYVYQKTEDWNPDLESPSEENRIYEEVGYSHLWGPFDINHRGRLEQRFQKSASGHNYQNRARYRFNPRLPLGADDLKSAKYYLSFYDEIFMNIGQGTERFYSQNRFFSGVGIHLTKDAATRLELGYLWQQNAASSSQSQVDVHIALFNLYLNTANF